MDSCPDLSAQDTTSADEEPTTSQSKKVRPAPVPGRFARIDDEEIYKFQEVNQSAATKKNTKWGLKLFQGKLSRLESTIVNIALPKTFIIYFWCSKEPSH